MSINKIAFLGLGRMGEPMVKVLLQAGYEVTVVPHVRKEPAERLTAAGAKAASNGLEAAQDADVIITILPNLSDVEQAVFGPNGIAEADCNGKILLNMSTVSPQGMIQLAERVQVKGLKVLDAPVSGGPTRAADGTLTIMAGCDQELFQQCLPLLNTLGKNVYYTGALGTGQVVKLANNMVGATIMAVTSEALTMGVKSGVDAQVIRDVILKSTGGSYLLENWMDKTVLQNQYEPGFALKLMYKDLGLARDLGKESDVSLIIGNLVHELYGTMKNTKYFDQDYSAISTLYQDIAGITIANGQKRER